MNKTSRASLIFFAVILLDQGLKYLIVRYFPQYVVLNKNGMWGLLPPWISLIGIVGIIFFIVRGNHISCALVGIIAAGFSNIADRIFRGGVVDYIHAGAFPVFNLADTIITLGVLLEIKNELMRESHD